MTSVTVRQAGAVDLAAITRLRRASAQEQEGEQADPGFEAAFASWFARETPHRIFWLVEVRGQPVGSMNLMVFDRMPRPGRPASGWGYLGNAFVLAPHRNQGIGGNSSTWCSGMRPNTDSPESCSARASARSPSTAGPGSGPPRSCSSGPRHRLRKLAACSAAGAG